MWIASELLTTPGTARVHLRTGTQALNSTQCSRARGLDREVCRSAGRSMNRCGSATGVPLRTFYLATALATLAPRCHPSLIRLRRRPVQVIAGDRYLMPANSFPRRDIEVSGAEAPRTIGCHE